jgi:dipeptidyl aminopeptidase/acylaminoacyl peptidase
MHSKFTWATVGLTAALMGAPTLAQDVVKPNSNLLTDGMPAISQAIADKVAQYTEFRGYGFVQWHPTDASMLVRHREAGANIPQIYRLQKPGGVLEKITDFPEIVAQAQYEPQHGKYLVISKDTGGNEATQIYRMSLDGKETTLLSKPDERSSFVWNKKSGHILIASVPLDKTATGGKRDQVFTQLSTVNPLQPQSSKPLTELPGGGWGNFEYSADGSMLAASLYRTPNDSDVYLINPKSGALHKILPAKGAPAAGFSNLAWSKDKRRLYLTTNHRGEFSELAYFDTKTAHLTILSSHIPWDVENFDLSEDGKSILAVVNANGKDEAHWFDAVNGKELPRPALPAGSIGGGQWSAIAKTQFAYALNSPQSPGDVFSLDLASGKTQRWTTAWAPADLQLESFVNPDLVQIKSFDGLPISGWLFLPDVQKFPGKRPVLVSFHGGPEGQSTVRFMGRMNYYLNEMGIAILLPNVRGSSGYGKSFLDMDNGFKRKDSVKDGGAFLTWADSHPRLDATRMVVYGGSYGGYMSLATAVDYSALIRGAIDVVGISSFSTFLKNTESYRRDLRRVEYGDERDPAMREFHEKIAPLNQAAAIQKPLFVVQGKNDPRVPYTEAEQMVAAVRKNGVPVWYLLADNEGHGFRRKANADYEFYSTVKFLETTLLQ